MSHSGLAVHDGQRAHARAMEGFRKLALRKQAAEIAFSFPMMTARGLAASGQGGAKMLFFLRASGGPEARPDTDACNKDDMSRSEEQGPSLNASLPSLRFQATPGLSQQYNTTLNQ